MSSPKYCLDIGRSRLKCSCSVPPPAFNVLPLPPIPTKKDDQDTVDEYEPEIVTTNVPFTDTSSNTLPDPKLLGTVFGIIFLIVILILICLYYFRKRQSPIGLDELAQGADRSKLKLSPSSCSQKPLLQTSSAASENPKLDNPQQPNGESEKMMMEITENTPKADKINDASFTGGDLNIPMIDDDDDEDIDIELVSRVILNESSC